MRNPRKLIALGVVAIPLLGALVIYLFLDPAQFKPVLVSSLSKSLRRQTSIESISFQIFPPGLRAHNLVISDDPQFSIEPFLKASNLDVRPTILPLLMGKLEIASIRVDSPQLELVQNAAGIWNVSTLGSNEPNSSSTKLDLLQIEKATLGVRRHQSPKQTYSDLSAEVRNFADGQPFQLRLAALMASGKSISAEGTITSTSQKTIFQGVKLSLADLKASLEGEVAESQMNLRLSIPKSNIQDVAPLFLPAGTTTRGEIVASVEAKGTVKEPRLQGRIDITGFEVSGGEIRQPVRTAKLGIALTPERISIEPTSIVSGSTQLSAFGVLSQYTTRPMLEATLLAPAAQLAELVAIARAYGVSSVNGMKAQGEARLQIRIHGALDSKSALAYAGSGSLTNSSIEVPTLKKPIEISTTTFRFDANEMAATNIAARLGTSNLTGTLSLSNPSQPNINFDLASDNLHLDELRSIIQSEPGSKPAQLMATGNLKVATLKAAELTLTQLAARATFRNGHLILDPLTASLYGGRHSGAMDIDLRPAQPQVELRSQLERIESSQLLAAATSLKGIISGPFGANLNLKFSPAEPVSLARSLEGKVSINFNQGRIASFNLTNELASIARFIGFNAGADRFTQFVGLTGDLEIHSGQATTQNLKLDLANMTASLTGNMNLADQTLDLKLLSVLDRRYSEQVGGNKIGGFMTAALANSSGNLMIPATIRGTFAKPVLAPDPGGIARLKLQNPKQLMDSVNSVIDLFKKKP